MRGGDREGSSTPGRAALPLGLALAVVAISTAAPVIKLADPLAPELIACLRVSVSAVALTLLAGRRGLRALRVLAACPREAALTAVAGLCLAAHLAAWIASLSFTSVVRSTALVSTQPLFAGLLARALGDRAAPRVYLGTALAIAGTAVMVLDPASLSGGLGLSTQTLKGDALALSGALTAALYLAAGRRVHAKLGDALPLEGYFVVVNWIACACLWAFALARGVDLSPPAAEGADYLALLWLGLVPGLIGHGLLNWAVRHVPVHFVSLSVLLEPAGAALFTWILLGSAPQPLELAGAAALLAGVAVGGVGLRGRGAEA